MTTNTERKGVDVLHTPTPWAVGFSDGSGQTYITAGDHPAIKRAEESVAVVVGGAEDSWGVPQGCLNPADAARIVACVNAMEGITDPASFMASLNLMAARWGHYAATDGGSDFSDGKACARGLCAEELLRALARVGGA